MKQKITLNPKIKFRTNNPGFVLAFDSEKNQLHEFNSTASEFILLIKDGYEKNEIIELLSKKYKLTGKQKIEVSSDFDVFLKNLEKLNIVTKSNFRMVHLFPTFNCNLECKHCYVNSGIDSKNKKEYTLDIHKKVINFINNNDFEVIHIEGGEPLYYSRIFDLLKNIKNKDALTLVTNGILLNEKNVLKIIKSGLKKIVVSLDGSNNKINSIIRGDYFEKTTSGLEKLKKAKGITKIISFTIHEKNKKNFESMLKLASIYGISEVRIGTLLSCGKGKKISNLIMDEKSLIDFYKEYEKIRKKYPKIKTSLSYEGIMRSKMNIKNKVTSFIVCDAGENQLAIGPDGEVYPCYNLVNVPEYVIGNIGNDLSFLNYDKIRLNKIKKQCPLTARGHLYLGDIKI